MALSNKIQDMAQHKLQAFCEQRIPLHVRDRVRLNCASRGSVVTLFEERIGFRDSSKWTQNPVAQFRHNPKTKEWTLYCADRNGRWHLYAYSEATKNIDDLIKAVDEDQTGIFWG